VNVCRFADSLQDSYGNKMKVVNVRREYFLLKYGHLGEYMAKVSSLLHTVLSVTNFSSK